MWTSAGYGGCRTCGPARWRLQSPGNRGAASGVSFDWPGRSLLQRGRRRHGNSTAFAEARNGKRQHHVPERNDCRGVFLRGLPDSKFRAVVAHLGLHRACADATFVRCDVVASCLGRVRRVWQVQAGCAHIRAGSGWRSLGLPGWCTSLVFLQHGVAEWPASAGQQPESRCAPFDTGRRRRLVRAGKLAGWRLCLRDLGMDAQGVSAGEWVSGRKTAQTVPVAAQGPPPAWSLARCPPPAHTQQKRPADERRPFFLPDGQRVSASSNRRTRRWTWCSSSCPAGIPSRPFHPWDAAACAGSRSSAAAPARSAGLRGGYRNG